MDDAIVLGTGLLNKVFIPYGTFGTDRTIIDRVEGAEFTPFGSLVFNATLLWNDQDPLREEVACQGLQKSALAASRPQEVRLQE